MNKTVEIIFGLVGRRLLDSLKIFFPISSEYLASDNVLREFIGKSEFNEG